MNLMRKDGRRAVRRAFRPTLGGPLEERVLLSTGQAEIDAIVSQILASRRGVPASSPAAGDTGQGRVTVDRARIQRHPIQTFVGNGGRKVRILDGTGDAFDVAVTGVGTVTARPMPSHDGRVKIIARGTTSASVLTITPVRPQPQQGEAHTFNPAFGSGDELLNVGQIVIRSGRIGQILGYRTANLSGPIRILGESSVSRIALNRILPGGTIQVANDLDTLDVFVDADLSGAGAGIFVGRDLNWMNIQGNLTIGDGATLNIGRDTGEVAQPGKGTAIGGQGILIQGNLVINPGGTFVVTRNMNGIAGGSSMAIRGNFNGTSRFSVGGSINQPITVLGTVTPT
jgi:hypothetical protein